MSARRCSSEAIDLRLGSCLAPDGLPSLADRSADLVLTDPPFDERTHRAAVEAGDWREGKRKVGAPLPFPPLDSAALVEVAGHLARVARRWIIVFAGECQADDWRRALVGAGARFVRLGLAERSNPRPQMSGDRPAPPADLLVIAHAPDERLRWHGGGRPARWTASAARFDPGGQIHPTQKPLAIVRALVADFSDTAELVLDPFAGGGTTAVACRETGRRFLGWEVNADYHGAAVERIARAREQLRLAPTAPPPEQVALALPLDMGEGE